MKNKKVKIFATLSVALLMLSACSSQISNHSFSSNARQNSSGNISQSTVSSSDDVTAQKVQHIKKTLSSGVEVDAEIELAPLIDLGGLSTYKAKAVVQDYEKAKDIFLKGKNIIQEEEMEENPESMTNSPYIYSQTEDGYSLSFGGENLHFGGELERKIYFFLYNSGEDKNDDKFLTGKDLGFASITEAQTEIEQTISEIGIQVMENPVVYTMDYETMKAENKRIYEKNKSESDPENINEIFPEDECYMFIYQQAVDGMPLAQKQTGMFGDGSAMGGSSVNILYTKEGIVKFGIDYQLSPIETLTQGEKGLTAEQALDLLDKKYNSIILEGEYLVNSISLEYIPMPENGEYESFILVPVWRLATNHTYELSGKENPEELVSWTDSGYVLFNAITGEEILTNAGSI